MEESRLLQKNYKEGCCVLYFQDSKRKQGIELCQERQMALGTPSQRGFMDWGKKIRVRYDLGVGEGIMRAKWGGRKGEERLRMLWWPASGSQIAWRLPTP